MYLLYLVLLTLQDIHLLKLLKYRSCGVKEYWIVDPEKDRVIVYNFTGDESINEYTLEDSVKAGIYEELVIDFGSMELQGPMSCHYLKKII